MTAAKRSRSPSRRTPFDAIPARAAGFRASSGEVLHAWLRKGSANTARGILRFTDELIARLRRAGASGEPTLRMASQVTLPTPNLDRVVGFPCTVYLPPIHQESA
jgi:hypothetical protein